VYQFLFKESGSKLVDLLKTEKENINIGGHFPLYTLFIMRGIPINPGFFISNFFKSWK
jgi:hypothetical protein